MLLLRISDPWHSGGTRQLLKKTLPTRPISRPTSNGLPLEGCYGGIPLPIPKIGMRSSGVVQISRWALTGRRGVSRGGADCAMIRIDPIHLNVEPMDMSTDTAVARIVAVFGAAIPRLFPGGLAGESLNSAMHRRAQRSKCIPFSNLY